jgi:hypothetical protein
LNNLYQIKVASPQPSHSAAPPQNPPNEPTLCFRAPDGTYYVSSDELNELRSNGLATEVVREIPTSEIPVKFFLADHGAVTDPPPEDARLAVLARLLSEERADGKVHLRYLGRNRSVPPDGFVQDRAGGDRAYVWQTIPAEQLGSRPELQERFRALRERFADPDTKVLLSLGSGGLKLFAHATAIRLLEMLDCTQHIDEVWGSSGGAVAGLLYSHGLSPQAIEQSGYDLYAGRYDVSLRPSKFQLLRHLLRDALLPSSEPGAAGFVDCAQGLARILDQYCASFQTRRPFYCIAFNLMQCRPEVLTPDPVPQHLRELLTQTDAREAVLASSTVPLLFVPRRILREEGEIPYIDGSTTEEVPLVSPLHKWDLDREAGAETRTHLLILYVKLSGSLRQYRSFEGRMGKLRLLQTVASVGIDTMHQRDVELVSQRRDVTLLGLRFTDSRPDFFETDRIPEFIRTAKETFPAQLKEIEDRLRTS